MRCAHCLPLLLLLMVSGCGKGGDVAVTLSPSSLPAKPAGSTLLPPHATFRTELKEISSIAVTPDGKLAAVHGAGKTQNLEVWNLEKNTKLLGLDNQNGGQLALALSPDGKKLFYEKLQGADEVETATKKVKSLTYTGNSYTFSPNADMVVTVSYGKIHVWDLARSKDWEWEAEKQEGRNISTRVYWGNPQRIAAGHEDGTISIWELDTGKPVKTLTEIKDKSPQGLRPDGHHPVAWSPDGKRLVSMGITAPITVWDIEKGKIEKALDDKYGKPAAVFLPDNRTLVYSKQKDGPDPASIIVTENLETGAKKVFEGHDGRIWTLVVSTDGKLLYSGGDKDGTLKVWKLDTP